MFTEQQIMQEFDNLLAKADDLWIIRKRKINTKILFAIMSQVLVKNRGIKHTLSYNSFDENNANNFSDAAICKSRVKCGYHIFDNIKEKLVAKFTKSKNIFAVDGSKFHLPDSFSKQGFTTRTHNSTRILGMISTIYNVDTKIPFNTLISKHYNERTSISQQLKFMPKDSTLIFDRGYYSRELVEELEKNNIKYLFRLKKDANGKVKHFYNNINNINKTIDVGNHKMRIFRYRVDGKTYICGTNMNSSVNYLKKLYKKRWTVEEGFKIMKSYLNLKYIHSKTVNLLKQEISLRELIFALTRLIQINARKTKKKKNHNVSFKLTLDFLINIDIRIIIDNILKINSILKNNQIKFVLDRRRIKFK